MLHIRVDGNPTIGLGHVMRCLAIADAVREHNEETVFLVADSCVESMLLERGYAVVVLHSAWDRLEVETETLISLIHQRRIEKLLIDSYAVTPAYLQKLRAATHVAYIDDVNAFRYPCHMLINYNIYAHQLAYPQRYPDTQLLIGCRYVPLRREFQRLPQRVLRKDVASVLVTTGGSDASNVAGKLVSRAKDTPDLRDLVFHIVAGPFHPCISELHRMENEIDGVVVHSSVSAVGGGVTMSRQMLDCDIAVSAGGSTLYELCACGTPTVAFALADNQLDGVAGLGRELMIGAGDVREDEEVCLRKMLEEMRCLITDYPRRLELAAGMQGLVDGQGALRIAEKIIAAPSLVC